VGFTEKRRERSAVLGLRREARSIKNVPRLAVLELANSYRQQIAVDRGVGMPRSVKNIQQFSRFVNLHRHAAGKDSANRGWAAPRSVKNGSQFLGFANSYRQQRGSRSRSVPYRESVEDVLPLLGYAEKRLQFLSFAEKRHEH
jgi:hypothetical protein